MLVQFYKNVNAILNILNLNALKIDKLKVWAQRSVFIYKCLISKILHKKMSASTTNYIHS